MNCYVLKKTKLNKNNIILYIKCFMNLFEEFNTAGNYYEIDNKILKYKLKKKNYFKK